MAGVARVAEFIANDFADSEILLRSFGRTGSFLGAREGGLVILIIILQVGSLSGARFVVIGHDLEPAWPSMASAGEAAGLPEVCLNLCKKQGVRTLLSRGRKKKGAERANRQSIRLPHFAHEELMVVDDGHCRIRRIAT
jgi:hypothetical protein